MLGDQPPLRQVVIGPTGPVALPSMRGFKIADAESPAPQNRIFLLYNYFSNLYGRSNEQLGAPLRNVNIHRTTFGFEQTILDGQASVGVKFPINFLSAQSDIAELNGFSTNVGNVTPVFKYVLRENAETGNLISTGFAMTIPTGPNSLFDSEQFETNNPPTLQPFFGLILNAGNFMFHTFSSIDVPLSSNNVVMLFSNSGIRYKICPHHCNRIVRRFDPTVEAHVSLPMNFRGGVDPTSPLNTADIVNLTTGVDIYFFQRTKPLRIGYVVPLTSDRPMDFEFMFELKVTY